MSTREPRLTSTATAASIDGRQFRFAGAVGAAFEPGALVVLGMEDGATRLGQIEEATFSIGRPPAGSGRILGRLAVDPRAVDTQRLMPGGTAPFHEAAMGPADAVTIESLYANSPDAFPIGTFLSAEHVAARLLPNRFNRHTFWCGQSGSGKTYALGVVVEQLLLRTDLPMVILDPNADFVRLREPQGADADPASLRDLERRDIRVLRSSSPTPLRVRFTDLQLRAKAAVLRLDPLADRAEHNELMHLEDTLGTMPADRVVSALRERDTMAALELAARVENLRVTDWSVWAGAAEAVTDILERRPDATVLDLGGFAYPDESLVVAMAVLDDLWAKREHRRPILIVIDEAHNLCSPEDASPLQVAVRERIIQIAAEGRKFGLWLLLSTQRPSRIHSSIISQCDNLALMKVTSPLDLHELGAVFGFVPEAMLARAARFGQGEALFAGGFVPAPTIVRMGSRLTREGGADVHVPVRPRGD